MKRIIVTLLVALCSLFISIGLVDIEAFANDVTEINWDNNDDAMTTDNEVAETIVDDGVKSEDVFLALGADLSADQLQTVLSLMGLSGQNINDYNVVYITNADEKQYLGQYVDASVIGSKALSSVLVKKADEGHGVTVTTQNINYCTEGMYRNALLTAGVENADIMVVGPTPISGTAALIGALKAYEQMSGEQVTDKSLDTALDELITTGEIANEMGNSEDISELVAFIKAEIAGKELNTPEEIEETVRKAVADYGADLTEEEIQKIIEVMIKIKELGLDYNTLLDQAEDLYAKYGDKISLEDLQNLETGYLVKKTVGQFFTTVLDNIRKFFGRFFG